MIGVFTSPPFNFSYQVTRTAGQICCKGDGTLPQGGVTSPLVSNLVCRSLDNSLTVFALKHKLRYTRYADDLTFSSPYDRLPKALIREEGGEFKIGEELNQIIESHTFRINHHKTRKRSPRRRQEVTGLTVNQFPNCPRRFVKGLERSLWECETKKLDKEKLNERVRVIRGRLAFLTMVRGKEDFLCRRLSRKFNRLFDGSISIAKIEKAKSCKLTNSVPKVNAWNVWVSKYESQVHLLEFKINGDTHAGTAFHVGNSIFATAGHNVSKENGEQHQSICFPLEDVENEIEVVSCLLGGNPDFDLAALKVKGLSLKKHIPTQCRLPEVGEEVCALGFPRISQREPCLVAHVGVIEALPVTYKGDQRYIQVSFQGGGGLSGGCLIDKAGFLIGIVVQNVFMGSEGADVPQKGYGQALPIEYFDEHLYQNVI